MARPFSLVLSLGAALIMLACSDKNNTPTPAASIAGAASAVPAAPAAGPTTVPVSTLLPVLASGSNPDWSIRIEAGSVTVKGFDGSLTLYPAVKAQISPASAQFSMGSGANSATLALEPGPCVDNHVSAMNATVSINGRSGTGCAVHPENPASADTSAEWVTALFEFVPGMRACLARSEAERAYANGIERRAEGSAFMRLHYADATQFACAAVGAQVSKFEVVVEPSESLIETPAFALSAAAFATLGCDEAPIQVFGSTGEALGYLQRGTCAASADPPAP